MDRDQALRDLIKAIRRANSKDATERDVEYARRFVSHYKSPIRDLDVESVIAELRDVGSTDEPHEISVDLRYALLLYFEGKIQCKRGAVKGRVTAAKLAALEAIRRSRQRRIPLRAARKEVVREWNASAARAGFSPVVTLSSVDAIHFPRRKRKS